MNTKLIQQTEVQALPYFPILEAHKSNRVITKHFTNLPLYLNPNHFALLTWLIYQSKADNSVKYSTKLLLKYTATLLQCEQEYKDGNTVGRLFTSLPFLRVSFQYLIKQGYLLPSHLKGHFVINPLLSYREEYIKPTEYRDICKEYNDIQAAYQVNREPYRAERIKKFTKHLFNIVASKMVAKKLTSRPKYEYGKDR